jgi:hypothetical protein
MAFIFLFEAEAGLYLIRKGRVFSAFAAVHNSSKTTQQQLGTFNAE